MRIINCINLTILLAASGGSVADIPSHCTTEEFSIVDAWMGDIYATEGGWRNKKNGKVVSLCSDKENEPFISVKYKYGEPGKIELEVKATDQAKFSIASIIHSPHHGEDLVFFRRGDYTYYVGMATAQGSGVSLYVFKGQKEIVSRFSGNKYREDYQFGPANINFMSVQPLTPVLKRENISHIIK